MIDVLHLIDTYRIGGPGKTIINSARYIDPARYRIHVASFTNTNFARNEFAEAVRRAGLPYLELKETRRFNRDHVEQIRDYVSRHAIGIVHTHGYRTDVMGDAAFRTRPVALVTTHHGWIRNRWRQVLFAKLALRLCARFHGVELVSERLRDEIPASFRHSAHVSVVHNGIVLQDYVANGRRDEIRRALDVSTEQPLLGVIGRLSIEKGCLEMLDAFALLVRTVPQARLLFVGEGPLHGQLLERARTLDIAERMRWVPHQTEVQPYFEAMDVLVSPSRTEGLSNVILEALAFERPVVATRVGGNAEILQDGVSGLLVASGAADQIAAGIGRVIQDDALRARLVSNGRERVRERFSFEARMRREEAFYDEALARRGAAAGPAAAHAR